MPEQLKRAYRGSDANMLSACGTIVENAIAHKVELITKRSIWADPFFPNLQTRIVDAFPNILGFDNAKSMRDATVLVNSIMVNALNDLSEFKVQIEQDFKADKAQLSEILNNLGFTQHGNGLRQKNQAEVIELLYRFKSNMTTALQTTITAKGTSPALITAIIGYATQLSNSNISQETLKTSRKVLNNENLLELNSIYNDVISVGTIAAKFFKNNKPVSEQFSYNKILNILSGTPSGNGNGAAVNPVAGETGGTVVTADQPV